VAAQIKSIFEQTPGVVDTDWYVEAPHAKITLAVDGEKAEAAGLSPAAVSAVVRMAGSGESAGLLHDERAREDVPIVIRLPRDDRSLEAVQSIRLRGTRPVAVGELTSAVTSQEGPSLYHKNLQAVTYVTGDLAGKNGIRRSICREQTPTTMKLLLVPHSGHRVPGAILLLNLTCRV
jgi:multidrug efflux pump subunit AcrB